MKPYQAFPSQYSHCIVIWNLEVWEAENEANGHGHSLHAKKCCWYYVGNVLLAVPCTTWFSANGKGSYPKLLQPLNIVLQTTQEYVLLATKGLRFPLLYVYGPDSLRKWFEQLLNCQCCTLMGCGCNSHFVTEKVKHQKKSAETKNEIWKRYVRMACQKYANKVEMI